MSFDETVAWWSEVTAWVDGRWRPQERDVTGEGEAAARFVRSAPRRGRLSLTCANLVSLEPAH